LLVVHCQCSCLTRIDSLLFLFHFFSSVNNLDLTLTLYLHLHFLVVVTSKQSILYSCNRWSRLYAGIAGASSFGPAGKDIDRVVRLSSLYQLAPGTKNGGRVSRLVLWR
jgi:hypothetical protein